MSDPRTMKPGDKFRWRKRPFEFCALVSSPRTRISCLIAVRLDRPTTEEEKRWPYEIWEAEIEQIAKLGMEPIGAW